MSFFFFPQKVFASRKELLEYDLQQREAATKSSRTAVQPTFTASQYRALSVLGCGHTSSTKCYGCASAVTEHCITLLRALATNPALRHILVSQGLIRELFDYNLRRGSAAMREEVRQLMCLLTRSEPVPGRGWGPCGRGVAAVLGALEGAGDCPGCS